MAEEIVCGLSDVNSSICHRITPILPLTFLNDPGNCRSLNHMSSGNVKNLTGIQDIERQVSR